MSPCDRIEEFPGENLCLRGEVVEWSGGGKYADYNFLTRVQNPETVDFCIIC